MLAKWCNMIYMGCCERSTARISAARAARRRTYCVATLQALRMLRGAPAPGPGLRLSQDGTAVVVAAGVHVPHLSPGSLKSLLQRFATAATDALQCAPCYCVDATYSFASCYQML